MIKVMWLDNDPAYQQLYAEDLLGREIEVSVAASALECERAVQKSKYDVLILDVMIPTVSEEEEGIYPPEMTEKGHQTGLTFIQRNSGRLKEAGTAVMVITARSDEEIHGRFAAAGFPMDRFFTRVLLHDPAGLADQIQRIADEGPV